jgi:pimeloyl-ACP methyl ester carboxylesterase
VGPPVRGGRQLRRIGAIVGLVLALAVAVPIAFRIAAGLRETELPRAAAPRDGRFVEADGLTIYVQERGRGSRTTVVLIHGSMAWSGSYHDLAVRLEDAGLHTVAIDLPPFGYSERPADHDYSRAAQARRVRAVLDALRISRASLVGHSFGGGATIEAAMTLGDRIERLALLDVALGLDEEGAPEPPVGALWSIGPVRDVLVASSFTNPMMLGPTLRDFVYDDAVVDDARIAIYARPLVVRGTTDAIGRWVLSGLYHDERAARSQQEDAYRRFEAPVMVVWGREDTVTPLAQGEHVASLFPHAELVVLDGVSHIPHVEDVDAVAARLVPFLAGRR